MSQSEFQKLCGKFDVDCPIPSKQDLDVQPAAEIVGDCQNVVADDAGQKYRLAYPDDSGVDYELASTAVDRERGEPGTPIEAGDVRPAVAKYGPTVVRGSFADWGTYEEMVRGETQIYDPVTSLAAVLKLARYQVQMPETVNRSHRSAMEDFVDWSNGWLHSLQGGAPGVIGETGETLLIYGSCLREILWGEDDDGKRHPVKLGYREPSTYDYWILNDAQDELAAVRFRSLDDTTILPHGDSFRTSPPTAKLYHAALNQRGNNFAGIPPTRPAIFWKKLKELLGQMAGLAADKYGIPVAKVLDAPVETDGARENGDYDKNDLFDDVKDQRSGHAPAFKIPSGVDIQYEAPPGQMPTMLDLLEYCDQQLAQPFKNEGSLLGQSSAVGSYALGRVQDDKFLRKAPVIAQEALKPINRLIRLTAKAYLEPQIDGTLPAYPTAEMRIDGLTDASAWLDDVIKAMGGKPMDRWPAQMQEAALEKLNLPKDTFESSNTEADDVAGTDDADDMPADDGAREQTDVDEEMAPAA